MEQLIDIVSMILYGVLGLTALWGAFSVVMVWRRVSQTRFRSEAEQSAFLEEVEQQVAADHMDQAAALCEGDRRAMPQLAMLAITNRDLGYAKVRQLVTDRFQHDVLADLENRLSWVYTVIKSAPMVGLLGTVIGMMGAFAKLASGDKVDPTMLAEDISFALVTTACGLAIAIPLVFCANSINVRISKMEDLMSAGLTRFLDALRAALTAK